MKMKRMKTIVLFMIMLSLITIHVPQIYADEKNENNLLLHKEDISKNYGLSINKTSIYEINISRTFRIYIGNNKYNEDDKDNKYIEISLVDGNVTFVNVTPNEASKEFWSMLTKAFPDFKKSICNGDSK